MAEWSLTLDEDFLNTPAHIVFSLAMVGHRRAWRYCIAVAAGALLPDLTMMAFYGYYRVLGTPESLIWSEKYYQPVWQAVFDLFNSIPLIAIGIALSAWKRATGLMLFFASMLIHCLLDLPVHHDDGHRHFYPLSDWRFQSPLSYWDPAHFGRMVGALEMTGVLAGVIWLWRHPDPPLFNVQARLMRKVLVATTLLYAGFLAFVMWTWSGQ